MINSSKKILLLSLGWMSLLLAVIGIPLPILPTTPFLLLAAYFFSKSSEKLHAWLLSSELVGPMIKDWEQYGVISKKAKTLAISMLVALFSYTLIFVEVAPWIKLTVSLSGLAVIWFILTRPSNRIKPTSQDHSLPN